MTDPVPAAGLPQARLARSRAELLSLLDSVTDTGGAGDPSRPRGFPRSMTMRLLTRGAGVGGLAALVVVLFTMSPSRARHLMRYLPLNAITRILVARLINGRRSSSRNPG